MYEIAQMCLKKAKKKRRLNKKLYFCSVFKRNDMPSFESLYYETEKNVREAVCRFSELKAKFEAVSRENEALRAERSMLREQLAKTEEKLKFVELTNTIIEKEDKTELKKQINEWVREIDSSIKLLSGQ